MVGNNHCFEHNIFPEGNILILRISLQNQDVAVLLGCIGSSGDRHISRLIDLITLRAGDLRHRRSSFQGFGARFGGG